MGLSPDPVPRALRGSQQIAADVLAVSRVSAPLASRRWKSLALPIELAARTPRRLHAARRAAVDEQRRARDVARPGGAQEHRGRGELLDRPEPARRDAPARRRPRPPRASRPCSKIRSVAIRPGRTRVERHAVGGACRASILNAATRPGRCALESCERARSARARPSRTTSTMRPQPRVAHPRQHALEEGHRGEHERAVRRLPLLAREAERVRRRPAGRRCWRRRCRSARARPRPRATAAGHRVEFVRVERRRRAADRVRPPRRRAPRSREATATRAPSAASARRCPWPMPFEPPVTSATRALQAEVHQAATARRAGRRSRAARTTAPNRTTRQRRAEPVRPSSTADQARDARERGAEQRAARPAAAARRPSARAHAAHAPGPAIQPQSSKNARGRAAPSTTASSRDRERPAARGGAPGDRPVHGRP